MLFCKCRARLAVLDIDIIAFFFPTTAVLPKEIPEIFRVIGKYNPELVKQSLEKLKGKLNDNNIVMRIHIKGAIKIIEKNNGVRLPIA